MTTFEDWLKRATRRLANESVDRVGAENRPRYQSAYAEALSRGADPDAAERIAVSALGDADAANFRYQRTLLTATEAHILRRGAREMDFIMSHFGFLLIAATAFCIGGVELVSAGATVPGRLLLALGMGTGLPILTTLFPAYALSHSGILQFMRLAVQVLALLLAFGPGGLNIYWLLVLCICQMIRSESVRNSIRRKLPVNNWPTQS